MSTSLPKISGLSRSIVLAAVTVMLLGMSSWHFTAFKPRTSLQLLSAPDRYLSLWRTPLMLSTGAVGYVVFLLGRVRLTNLFIVCR